MCGTSYRQIRKTSSGIERLAKLPFFHRFSFLLAISQYFCLPVTGGWVLDFERTCSSNGRPFSIIERNRWGVRFTAPSCSNTGPFSLSAWVLAVSNLVQYQREWCHPDTKARCHAIFHSRVGMLKHRFLRRYQYQCSIRQKPNIIIHLDKRSMPRIKGDLVEGINRFFNCVDDINFTKYPSAASHENGLVFGGYYQ